MNVDPCRRRLIAALPALPAVWALPLPARAQAAAAATPPPEVSASLPGARRLGSAVMRFFGLQIYDARLWSLAPLAADYSAQPLALELVYARALVGEQIASRSLDEMRRIGEFDEPQSQRWLRAMTRLFPDVQAGDRLTGVNRPAEPTRFFFNGQPRGEVADADFPRLFFGIWLSPRTSEPRLRQLLLGGAP